MNTPFKGQIDWLPDFIGKELMKQQEYQGNKSDISVFEEDVSAEKSDGGFDWKDTLQKYNFWDRVLLEKDINLFLAWFTPELEVFDYEDKKHLAQVIAYCPISSYPICLNNIIETNVRFKHAQLPKKNDSEKTALLKKVEELTKQANELLTKAAKLKAAAEKL